jgi:hypothetical protein
METKEAKPYRGPQDGSIKSHIKKAHEDSERTFPTFIGYEPFRQLLEMGVLIPDIATVRIFGSGRDDEHYTLHNGENGMYLKGVYLGANSIEDGNHSPEKVFKRPNSNWEIDGLSTLAFRGS